MAIGRTIYLVSVILPMFGVLFSVNGFTIPIKKMIGRNDYIKRAYGVDMGGSFNITYYTELLIGNPPQSVNVILDSGSSDLIIFSPTCTGIACTTPGTPLYTDSDSSSVQGRACNSFCKSCSTYKTLPACYVKSSYGGGQSYTGPILNEEMQLGGLAPATGAPFLYTLNATGGNRAMAAPIGGLWGIAYSNFAASQVTPNAWDVIINANKLTNSFSMCFGENPVMSVGVDYSNNYAFTWTPVNQTSLFYFGWDKLIVGETDSGSAELNPAIMDSGTSLTYFRTSKYSFFYNTLTLMCNTITLVGFCDQGSEDIFTKSRCVPMTDIERDQYPNLTMTFSQIPRPFVFPPKSYIYDDPNTPGQKCGGIATLSGVTFNIFGDTFMQDYHIVFDKTRKQLGFADLSTCPTTGVLENVSVSSTAKSAGLYTTVQDIVKDSNGNALVASFFFIFSLLIATVY